ncbi:hypothetical protein Tco_1327486 [Tanacetum coccineum]
MTVPGLTSLRTFEESIIPLNEIISQLPSSIAITPVLPIEDPEDSLIMGDEELSTIHEKESDDVIKSSVEDLVPIPSESEDTSGSDRECDLPSCNDFSPISVSEEKSCVSLFHLLFNSNVDFTSKHRVCKDSRISNLDEPALLVTPLSDFNEDECFNPGGDVDVFELLHLDCPDFKGSRAHGFVHRSLDLQSLACFYMRIRYS